MTWMQAITGRESLGKQVLLVLAGTMLIAICAQISVPFYPVPMTLQTLAVLLVGAGLGARLGAITVLTYLAQGAAGLPVFANGMNGAALFGPTAGFLIGFVAMAWIVGLVSDRGWMQRLVPAVLTCILASAVIYLPGLAWPFAVASALGLEGGWTALTGAQIWAGFAAPFLLGDLVKALLVAMASVLGAKALKR